MDNKVRSGEDAGQHVFRIRNETDLVAVRIGRRGRTCAAHVLTPQSNEAHRSALVLRNRWQDASGRDPPYAGRHGRDVGDAYIETVPSRI